MSNIADRQTFCLSFDFTTLIPSRARIPIILRFRADEMVVKSLSYANHNAHDTRNVVQIWCDKTVDPLIGQFPNFASTTQSPNTHIRLSNPFQADTLTLEFQQTENAPVNGSFSNPQQMITAEPDPGVVPPPPVLGNTWSF